MLETEAQQRKKDTDFRCNMMEEEEVGHFTGQLWGRGFFWVWESLY